MSLTCMQYNGSITGGRETPGKYVSTFACHQYNEEFNMQLYCLYQDHLWIKIKCIHIHDKESVHLYAWSDISDGKHQDFQCPSSSSPPQACRHTTIFFLEFSEITRCISVQPGQRSTGYNVSFSFCQFTCFARLSGLAEVGILLRTCMELYNIHCIYIYLDTLNIASLVFGSLYL